MLSSLSDVHEPGPLRASQTCVALLGERRFVLEALAQVAADLAGVRVRRPFADGRELVAAARNGGIGLVIAELGPGCEHAATALYELRMEHPELPILLVVDRMDAPSVQLALALDIAGVVSLESSSDEIGSALQQVIAGNAVLPANWRSFARAPDPGPVDHLSSRQREVLELLAAGATNEQIAERLFISANTVKFHIRAIYERLGINSRVQAARLVAGAEPAAQVHPLDAALAALTSHG